MIDVLEKATIQDLALANAFGIDEDEVKRISLHQMKNEMHHKAFDMRHNNIIITQEEAYKLNKRLEEIKYILEEKYDYDGMSDYWIDFNSFVKENPCYNRFMW
ncbi:MAG: hypothetical protein PHT02_01170 [Tissierellia bacterium]|nr:hypothetical protein [Tissierellia bacterium]